MKLYDLIDMVSPGTHAKRASKFHHWCNWHTVRATMLVLDRIEDVHGKLLKDVRPGHQLIVKATYHYMPVGIKWSSFQDKVGPSVVERVNEFIGTRFPTLQCISAEPVTWERSKYDNRYDSVTFELTFNVIW